MYNTYEDARDATLSRKEAMYEIKVHYASWDEFVAECGDWEEYSGKTVLDFLGY